MPCASFVIPRKVFELTFCLMYGVAVESTSYEGPDFVDLVSKMNSVVPLCVNPSSAFETGVASYLASLPRLLRTFAVLIDGQQ